jgi:hypothetical protein
MTALYDAELAAVDGLGLTDVDMDLIVSLLDDYVRDAAHDPARFFSFGLRRIIDGIEAFLSTTSR